MALYDLLLQGGRTYDPETRTFAREDVAVREGKIVLRAGEIPSESAATVLDAQGCVVSPGLIDMHVHGYLGADASDGSFEGLRVMAEGLARNGVTGFLPTTMTVPEDELRVAFAQIRAALAGQPVVYPTFEQVVETAIRHGEMMRAWKQEHAAVTEMRKHMCWYIHGRRGAARLRTQLTALDNLDDVYALLRQFAREQSAQSMENCITG